MISKYVQRLLNGHSTTRGPNPSTKAKQTRRDQYKEKYLAGSYSAVKYLNVVSLTVGHDNMYPIEAPAHPRSTDDIDVTDDPTEDEENSGSQCNVCLLARVENFALLHDECLHGGFCQMCAKKY